MAARLANRGGKDNSTNRASHARQLKEDASSDDEPAVPAFDTLNVDPPEDITGIFDKVEERKMPGNTPKHPSSSSNTLRTQGVPKYKFKKSSCCFPW